MVLLYLVLLITIYNNNNNIIEPVRTVDYYIVYLPITFLYYVSVMTIYNYVSVSVFKNTVICLFDIRYLLN